MMRLILAPHAHMVITDATRQGGDHRTGSDDPVTERHPRPLAT